MPQSSKDLIEEMRWQVRDIKNKQAEQAELFGKVDAARDRLAALEVRVTSPDGTVTVTVGSGGIVRSVELADDAVRSNAATLTAAINASIKQAIADATRQQLEIVRDAVGTAVDPDQVLGPQAKFAGYGHQHEATTSPSTRGSRFSPDEDEFQSVFE